MKTGLVQERSIDHVVACGVFGNRAPHHRDHLRVHDCLQIRSGCSIGEYNGRQRAAIHPARDYDTAPESVFDSGTLPFERFVPECVGVDVSESVRFEQGRNGVFSRTVPAGYANHHR